MSFVSLIVVSFSQSLEIILINMVVIALFGFVWFPGIRAPLSFSFFTDLGGACLVFLVLVNL